MNGGLVKVDPVKTLTAVTLQKGGEVDGYMWPLRNKCFGAGSTPGRGSVHGTETTAE